MKKKIEEKIKQLSSEIEESTLLLNKLEQEKNEIATSIISKNGALIELRKLIKTEGE